MDGVQRVRWGCKGVPRVCGGGCNGSLAMLFWLSLSSCAPDRVAGHGLYHTCQVITKPATIMW